MKTTKTVRTKNDARANGDWQGMNWIRQEKRLAIYCRDGLACAWCGDSVENGTKLTLDHLTPHSKGGSNHETNLVTCCHRCNCSRGNRSVKAFAADVATYLGHDVEPKEILSHVVATAKKPLAEFKVEAKKLIARRGSAARVLAIM